MVDDVVSLTIRASHEFPFRCRPCALQFADQALACSRRCHAAVRAVGRHEVVPETRVAAGKRLAQLCHHRLHALSHLWQGGEEVLRFSTVFLDVEELRFRVISRFDIHRVDLRRPVARFDIFILRRAQRQRSVLRHREHVRARRCVASQPRVGMRLRVRSCS